MKAGGDNPFDLEGVRGVGVDNNDGATVLGTGGSKPIDGVGSGKADLAIISRDVAQQDEIADRESESSQAKQSDKDLASSHIDEPRGDYEALLVDPDEQLVIPRWLKAIAAGFAVLIVGAIAFAYFQPVTVLPRIRVAPGYLLEEASGASFNSDEARGTVTLYAFRPADCGAKCDEVDETMRRVRDGIVTSAHFAELEEPVRLVTVVLDPNVDVRSERDLALAIQRTGEITVLAEEGIDPTSVEPPEWLWLNGDDDTLRRVVGEGFRQYYELKSDGTVNADTGYVLVDSVGIIRGDYKYSTLADTADKLTRHIDTLGEEMRYASGALKGIYEAAHLFRCYSA